MEEFEEYQEEDIDDDFDVDIDESSYLEDDEVLQDEEEELDDEMIYEQLSKRNSPYARQYHPVNSLTNEIVANESGGDYKAFNSAGGGEGAVGKYQFRWTAHKDKIRKYANNPNLTKEQFMNSPELQDGFYEEEWIPKYLDKDVKNIRNKGLGKDLNNKQLYKLVHFRGGKGAEDYLTGKVGDNPESYNSSISKYIGMQRGGVVDIPTNFKTSSIDFNYPLALKDKVEIDSNTNNLDEVSDILQKGYDIFQGAKGQIAEGLSDTTDMAETFTSQQIQNQQLRKQMQQLYGDNPSNYAPVSQRINNNPILI